jgi:protein TonB
MTYALDMIAQQRARAVRWTLATVIVLSAHVGAGAYALMRNSEDIIEEDSGSPVMMELAPLAVASPVDSPDVAHGPLQEEAVTTPPTTEKAPEKTFADIPPVEQAPLAPDPEVVLPTPDPIKEKKVEEEKKAEEPAPEKQEKVDPAVGAPLTAAPPRVEAPPAPTATANAAGTAARPATVPLSWQKQLMSHLNRFKRYPDAARARGLRGVTNVAFTIDRSGRVMAAQVAQGSGSTLLDDEAIAIIQRSSPMPAPPLDTPGETFDLVLPVQFQIH